MESMKKAKDAQHAAGKNTGMSGRDLVSIWFESDFREGGLIGRLDDAFQFTYNPEWFQEEEDDAEDEWDLEKYRRETQEQKDAEEEERIQSLHNGYREAGTTNGVHENE